MRRLDVEVAIVGAGPGGLAAARDVVDAGCRVALVDDAPAPGGQIWRAMGSRPAAETLPFLGRLANQPERVCLLTATQIVDCLPRPDGPPVLLADAPDGPVHISAASLILATGAMERFLPFPGWTLPGVVGAGGLQALIKGGFEVAGQRVVVAGSGPLLPAVADLARRRGARVVALAEQATRRSLLPFARTLLRRPDKALQAAGLLMRLMGVAKRFGAWPVRAEGDVRLERITLRDASGGERTLECDFLACGFGLVPRVALARLLGCQVEDAGDGALRVVVDDRQQTSVAGIYAVGEATGVGGVDKAIAEGRVAGPAAAGAEPLPAHLLARDRERRFADAIAFSFALRPELRDLPSDDTIICRCEDVPWREIENAASARDAKLNSRCGMGPCQARVCGTALAFLRGWTPESPRPPLFPTDLRTLSTLYSSETHGADDA